MQQPRTPLMMDVPVEITKNVKTWCCCDKGNVNIKAMFEKNQVRMNESVAMRFSADNSACKIDIVSMLGVLQRKLILRTRAGRQKQRAANMISVPTKGLMKGEKTKEDLIVAFDMNQAMDLGTPTNLSGSLGEFAGRIQQSCNGQLITCYYELHVTAQVDGTVCCDTHPTASIPVEILAPEKVLAFIQIVPTIDIGLAGVQGEDQDDNENQSQIGMVPQKFV